VTIALEEIVQSKIVATAPKAEEIDIEMLTTDGEQVAPAVEATPIA
jgi:hypothetical protein